MHIFDKVNKKLFILCLLKKIGFSKDELIIAWTTIIRLITEYAAPLWHSGLNKQKKALGLILDV